MAGNTATYATKTFIKVKMRNHVCLAIAKAGLVVGLTGLFLSFSPAALAQSLPAKVQEMMRKTANRGESDDGFCASTGWQIVRSYAVSDLQAEFFNRARVGALLTYGIEGQSADYRACVLLRVTRIGRHAGRRFVDYDKHRCSLNAPIGRFFGQCSYLPMRSCEDPGLKGHWIGYDCPGAPN